MKFLNAPVVEWPKYGIYAQKPVGEGSRATQELLDRVLNGPQSGLEGELEASSEAVMLRETLLNANKKHFLGREWFGESPPGLFVGRHGYPKVAVGPMVSLAEGHVPLLDSPADWYGRPLEEIVLFRSILLRGKRLESVRLNQKVPSSTVEAVQETAMAVKPLDLELHFERDVQFRMEFSDVSQPSGPSADLKRLRLTENPVIPKKVDRLKRESEEAGEGVKAKDAGWELLAGGFDAYYVQKVLSAGVLGIEKKLVPTRWSITATDSMLADYFISKVKERPSVDEFHVYESTYLWNHFVVLVLPGAWSFEQFEAWMPKSNWHADSPAVKQLAQPALQGGHSKLGAVPVLNLDIHSNPTVPQAGAVSPYVEARRGMVEQMGGYSPVKSSDVLLDSAGRSVPNELAPSNTSISQEYEPYDGRSDYAASQGGGYYAARFGAAEGLANLGRQGRVVVFREIDPSYNVPVGVWQVRENVRHALAEKPIAKFSSQEEAVAFLRNRLKVPWRTYWTQSQTLAQKSLTDF